MIYGEKNQSYCAAKAKNSELKHFHSLPDEEVVCELGVGLAVVCELGVVPTEARDEMSIQIL